MIEVTKGIRNEHLHEWLLEIKEQDAGGKSPGYVLWDAEEPSDSGHYCLLEESYDFNSDEFYLLRKLIWQTNRNEDFVVVFSWGKTVSGVKLNIGTGDIVESVWQ
jgi:hypothetical protein